MAEETRKFSTKTAILWQVLSFACAFFACSFLTGLEGLFAALAAAFATALTLSSVGPLSLLSTAAGALLGYAFALWSENGGVLSLVINEPLLFENTVDLTLDLRLMGALWMLALAGMIASGVILIRKGYSRTACVAANTFWLVATRIAAGVLIFRSKYGVFSFELLREKINLLGDCLGNLLEQAVMAQQVEGLTQEVLDLRALGTGVVYTLPLMFLVSCGIYAFFHSYLCKRLMRRCGLLSPQEPWSFMPSLTSAFVYVALSVASFFVSAFQAGSATSYALSLLSGFLSWLFFVPGLSAIRLLLAKRKSQGKRTPWVFLIVLAVMFPLLLSLAVNIIPTVGLVFVVVAGLKKRAMEKQNRN